MVLARRAVARFSTRYSRKRLTLHQYVVLLCLKVKKTNTYRDLIDELIEMTRIRDALDLDSIPAPSTLCKAFDRLEMAVWRVLLNVSLADSPLNGVTGIDASGLERVHTSTHYMKRTNLTIQQLKTTLFVDTATNAVLDIHVTTTRKRDT
jgi:IS5 family transposase